MFKVCDMVAGFFRFGTGLGFLILLHQAAYNLIQSCDQRALGTIATQKVISHVPINFPGELEANYSRNQKHLLDSFRLLNCTRSRYRRRVGWKGRVKWHMQRSSIVTVISWCMKRGQVLTGHSGTKAKSHSACRHLLQHTTLTLVIWL